MCWLATEIPWPTKQRIPKATPATITIQQRMRVRLGPSAEASDNQKPAGITKASETEEVAPAKPKTSEIFCAKTATAVQMPRRTTVDRTQSGIETSRESSLLKRYQNERLQVKGVAGGGEVVPEREHNDRHNHEHHYTEANRSTHWR